MVLVGRQREIEELRRAVAEHRVVTLWGPPGVGKSALARAAWPHAAFAQVTDSLVEPVAAALGVETTEAPPLAAIARALTGRRIILDGADPVVDELAGALERWRDDAGAIVITARERIDGVHAVAVEPLALADAVALWRQATQRIGHRCDDQLAAEIVTRLDRLPMAIEWFASRAAVLGDDAALARLESFSEGSSPLDPSIDTLDDAERDELASIAMYQDGARAQDVELDLVDRLARRALVRLEPGRVTAYRVVIKRMRAWARAHDRFDSFARTHAQQVLARDDPPRRELDAIIERFRDTEPALALRACLAYAPSSLRDGDLIDTADTLRALCATVASDDEQASGAWLMLGRLERRLGRLEQARQHLERARSGGEVFAVAVELAHLDRTQSRSEAALEGYEHALTIAADGAEACIAHGEIGRMLQSLGRYRQAQQRHEQAIALSRAQRLPGREALERSLHARATHRAGDIREAIPLHKQALSLHLELGDHRLAAAERGHLAFCHHELDEMAPAEAFFRASIDGLAKVGDVVLEAIERILLARLLNDGERFAEANLELAIVDTLTRDLDAPRIEMTRLFVGGLGEQLQGRGDEASDSFRRALALGSHLEVGFEALLPAHLAYLDDAAPLNDQHRARINSIDTPGLKAALTMLEGGDVDAALLSTSSDARRARRLTRLRRAGGDTGGGLIVAADARSVVLPDGSRVDLGRRVAPRRVLLTLAEARHDRAGEVLSFDDLIGAGWPNERMSADAARKRLRTVIWTLRKLGLEPLLLTRDDGYLLDPLVPFHWGKQIPS